MIKNLTTTFVLSLCLIMSVRAQETVISSSSPRKPDWVIQMPPETNARYLRMEGAGKSVQEAKQDAGKQVIMEIAKEKGCNINLSQVNKVTQHQKDKEFKIEGEFYSVSEMVCPQFSTEGLITKDSYWEKIQESGQTPFYRYYLLVAFPVPKLVKPGLAVLYSIFPGGGQMYKKDFRKIIAIWGGLGGLTGLWLYADNRKDYWDRESFKFNANRDYYLECTRRERNWRNVGITAIIAGGALYVCNLADAGLNFRSKKIRTAVNHLDLKPINNGLALSYSFN